MVWHYPVCFQGPKSARSSRDNGLWPPTIRLHNDRAGIRAVMDQNVKQCKFRCVYIRWFDITAFAFNLKVQEVVEITASGPLHSLANIINYIYSKFHNDLACIRDVMDQNMKQCSDFAVYFYQIRWFDITAFAFKAPKVQEVVKITAFGPLHSFANIMIYSKFHNDLACIWAVMDQNVKQCTDFAVYFHQIRWFDITPFASKPKKCKK